MQTLTAMKRNSFFALTMCFALCAPQCACAQQMTAQQKHQMLLNIVDLFEEYEKYSAIDEDFQENVSPFRSLFATSNAFVFNDLIGITPAEENIPLGEYVAALATESGTTRVSISNISHDDFTYENGVWKIRCTFNKNVNVSNRCGVEFASEFLYTEDYKLTAVIRCDFEENTCRFERIEGQPIDRSVLPDGYRILKASSNHDKDVTFDGKPLRFNAMSQAFVSPTASISYPDPEATVLMIPVNEGCNIWKMKYIPRLWRLNAHADIVVGDFYSIESSLSSLEAKSSGTEFGVDMGRLLNPSSKTRISFNFGLGYSSSTLDLNLNADKLSYECEADNEANGLAYTRVYEGILSHETIKVGSVVVPLYFDFERAFSKWISGYAQVGLRNYINISSSLDNQTHIDDIYGVFPTPYNGVIDYHYPYDGFRHDLDMGNSQLVEQEVATRLYSVDAFAALGVRVRPVVTLPLYLNLGVGYQMGLLDPFDTSGYGKVGQAGNPLSYYTLDSNNLQPFADGSEHLNSLVSSLSTWRRQHLKVNLGLVYKF